MLSGIIGSGGETKISEVLPEIGQIGGGSGYGLFRVERVSQFPAHRRRRDELRYALRARGRHCTYVKPAFLPDEPGEIGFRQAVLFGGSGNQVANGGRIIGFLVRIRIDALEFLIGGCAVELERQHDADVLVLRETRLNENRQRQRRGNCPDRNGYRRLSDFH